MVFQHVLADEARQGRPQVDQLGMAQGQGAEGVDGRLQLAGAAPCQGRGRLHPRIDGMPSHRNPRRPSGWDRAEAVGDGGQVVARLDRGVDPLHGAKQAVTGLRLARRQQGVERQVELVGLLALKGPLAEQEAHQGLEAGFVGGEVDPAVDQGAGLGPRAGLARGVLGPPHVEGGGFDPLRFGLQRRVHFARPGRRGGGVDQAAASQLGPRQVELPLGALEQLEAGIAQRLLRLPPATGRGEPADHPRGALDPQGLVGLERLGHADEGFGPPGRPGRAEVRVKAVGVLQEQPRIVVRFERRRLHVSPESQDEPVQLRNQMNFSGRSGTSARPNSGAEGGQP